MNGTSLEVKINALSQEFNSLEVKQLVDKAAASMSNLHALYHDGNVIFKRQIINAIYPQKLEYDGHQFRTTHLNELIATIFILHAPLQKQKSGQNGQTILPALKRGLEQIRTAVEAFAELCLATRPRDQHSTPKFDQPSENHSRKTHPPSAKAKFFGWLQN